MPQVDILHPRTGEVIGFKFEEEASIYKSYTYAEFIELLMTQGTTRKLMQERRKETDTGYDIDAFLELLKAKGSVDFSSPTSRARLESLVPLIFSPVQATEVMGG